MFLCLKSTCILLQYFYRSVYFKILSTSLSTPVQSTLDSCQGYVQLLLESIVFLVVQSCAKTVIELLGNTARITQQNIYYQTFIYKQ